MDMNKYTNKYNIQIYILRVNEEKIESIRPENKISKFYKTINLFVNK